MGAYTQCIAKIVAAQIPQLRDAGLTHASKLEAAAVAPIAEMEFHGMCIDSEGNLYVAAGLHETRNTSETLDTRPGIHVVSPQGKLLAFRETPVDTITNCTFGGADQRTLYITCGNQLLQMRTQIPGKASYRPTA